MHSSRITFDLRLAVMALSALGWVFGSYVYWRISEGHLRAGVDLEAYVRAGQDLLAGRPVYVGQIGERLIFSYAPPLAVLCAALAWIPGTLLQLAVVALDLLALRYLAGGWLRVGLVFFFPISVFVMVAGNLEVLIAAAIVLAWRSGRVEPLVAFGLAKMAPAMALPPRHWRAVAISLAVAVAVTLPWLHLWQEWVEYLLRQPAIIPFWVPIPWFYRLPLALALLLAFRRPWVAALAVVVAMPALYASTLMILLAPLRLLLDERAAAAATTRELARPTVLELTIPARASTLEGE